MELLVARAAGAQGELLHPVAAEGRVRVAVDEAGKGTEAAAVELLGVARLGELEIGHAPDRHDLRALAEDVGIFEHVDSTQVRPAERCRRACG